jgi:hypothetical protein
MEEYLPKLCGPDILLEGIKAERHPKLSFQGERFSISGQNNEQHNVQLSFSDVFESSYDASGSVDLNEPVSFYTAGRYITYVHILLPNGNQFVPLTSWDEDAYNYLTAEISGGTTSCFFKSSFAGVCFANSPNLLVTQINANENLPIEVTNITKNGYTITNVGDANLQIFVKNKIDKMGPL